RAAHRCVLEALLRRAPGSRAQAFVVGTPLTPPGAIDGTRARAEFGLGGERRTVLVFGGSHGARALNETIARVLQRGQLGDVNLLWGTGTMHLERYTPLALPGRGGVGGGCDPTGSACATTDPVVARRGGMASSE